MNEIVVDGIPNPAAAAPDAADAQRDALLASTAWDDTLPAYDGKNPWRPVPGYEEVHEMHVGHQRRALYDASRQEEVARHPWTLHKPNEANSYIKTGVWNPVRKQVDMILLHRYLHADEIEAYQLDHLAPNSKHNNTRANLRNGDNGQNNRNRRLKSDGVVTNDVRKVCIAKWSDKHGKHFVKEFKWSEYGASARTC
jgi:hypothetical protein